MRSRVIIVNLCKTIIYGLTAKVPTTLFVKRKLVSLLSNELKNLYNEIENANIYINFENNY